MLFATIIVHKSIYEPELDINVFIPTGESHSPAIFGNIE